MPAGSLPRQRLRGPGRVRARVARGLLTDPENTITSIAKLLGVSRTTLYKYVPELAAGRGSLVTSESPPALPGPR